MYARLAYGREYVELPSTKSLTEAKGAKSLPESIHARMAVAVGGEPFIAIPTGTHQKLAEAMGTSEALPEGIHQRMARAFSG